MLVVHHARKDGGRIRAGQALRGSPGGSEPGSMRRRLLPRDAQTRRLRVGESEALATTPNESAPLARITSRSRSHSSPQRTGTGTGNAILPGISQAAGNVSPLKPPESASHHAACLPGRARVNQPDLSWVVRHIGTPGLLWCFMRQSHTNRYAACSPCDPCGTSSRWQRFWLLLRAPSGLSARRFRQVRDIVCPWRTRARDEVDCD